MLLSQREMLLLEREMTLRVVKFARRMRNCREAQGCANEMLLSQREMLLLEREMTLRVVKFARRMRNYREAVCLPFFLSVKQSGGYINRR